MPTGYVFCNTSPKKEDAGNGSDIQDIIELTQPSISHHIKILLESGLIEQEKEGRHHKYNLNEQLVKEYTTAINHFKPA